MSLSGQANTHAMREFRRINDRLSPILPTAGAFRRRQHAGEMAFVQRSLIVLLVFSQPGCSSRSDAEGDVIYQPVSAYRVAQQPEFALGRSFTGVVQPTQSADIAFGVSGKLQAVLANEGDRVEKGDLLARLDTDLLVVERRQLQAQLLEAQANLRLTRANLERHASLEGDGYVSRQRRDELEASRDVIRASIQQLEARLDGNTVMQDKAHLLAPFAGVISERFMEEGSAAAPAAAVFRVLETGRLEAHVGVPRKLASTINEGDVVELVVAGETTCGEVLAVGAELKVRSHSVMIRITLPRDFSLAGSVVELQLQDRIVERGFLIPESALTASLRGLWRVYVLKPQTDDLYMVEARDLQLRYSGEVEAYVTRGLRDGETIVASGVHKIVPGQLVRVIDAG